MARGLHDGRIKPDVVAPGSYIISAYSDDNPYTNQCMDQEISSIEAPALTVKHGTSMAAPLVAGAAVLVRQW